MRLLEKNKQSIYVSICTGTVEAVDDDGNYTGDLVKQYSVPMLTSINLYPSSGSIVREVFGDAFNGDMLTVTTGKPFSKNDVFYLSDNVGFTNYDYYISDMKTSLNNTYYGLKKRV